MDEVGARDLAAKALIFIAQEPDRIGRFLARTGIGPSEIRARTQDAAFLGGILDYLLSDEAMLIEFAGWAEVDASFVTRCRHLLPGGEVI